MSLNFRVLGPLEVSDAEDHPVAVRGLRRRALVLRLLLNPNHVVASDTLVEDVWVGDPPDGALGTLQSHVSLLRRLVGPRLQSRPPGYVLEVGEHELDASLFALDVAGGRSRLEQNRAGEAAGQLAQALARWRGRALLDVADTTWALAETERLEQLRVNAVELQAEALLRSHRVDEAVSLAELAVATHPLRERLWAHLIVGLTRQGRQADALRAYQRLRQQLGEQLGIEPSPSLVALEDAVLMQRPIGNAWEPTGGGGPLTVERRPHPVGGGERAAAGPPSGSLSSRERAAGSAGMPRSGGPGPNGLCGRAGALRVAMEAWASVVEESTSSLVVVTGRPGMGRARFSRAVASQAAETGASVLEVPGGGGAGVAAALAGELGHATGTAIGEPSAEHLVERVAAAARQHPICLLVHDLQEIDEAGGELFDRLLRGDGPVLVVATASQAALDPRGAAQARPALRRLLWPRRGGQQIRWIELGALDLDDLVELVAIRRSDVSDPRPLARWILDDTGGNPLLAADALGAGTRHGHGPSAAVVALVNEWAGALDAETMAVVCSAAVVGHPLDHETLGEIVDKPEGFVLDALEAAVDADLASDAGTKGFAIGPPALARVLARRLGPSRRAVIHRRAARVLAEQRNHTAVDVERIAGHWLTGGRPADATELLRWSHRAGRAASERRAWDAALAWLEVAQRSAERIEDLDASRRAELLIDLSTASAAARGSVPDRLARGVIQAARESEDPMLLARAVLALTGSDSGVDVPLPVIREAAETALRQLPPEEPGLGQRLLPLFRTPPANSRPRGRASADARRSYPKTESRYLADRVDQAGILTAPA